METDYQSALALEIGSLVLAKENFRTLYLQTEQARQNLQAELENLTQRNQELEALLNEATSPSTETKEDDHEL